LHQRSIGVGPAIAEELPGVADLADHVEIDLVDQQFVLVVAACASISPRGLTM
jgi:hypothetical protein